MALAAETDVGTAAQARPQAARFALVALVVATAAAVDPWGFRPFTTLRWPMVATATLAAAALLWRYRPALPRVVVLLGSALMLWMALATITGLDGLIAWIGHPQRHFGLLAWVVCISGFVAGTACGARERRVLGVACCVGSGLLGAGALAELIGVDIADAAFPGLRAGGFLGQPAYLGALAVLVVPIAASTAIDARGRWRWATWASVASGIIGAIASMGRGAALGMAVAGLVALAGAGRLRAQLPLVAAAALFAAAVVVVAALPGAGGQHSEARGRLDEWAVATRVIGDRPLLGTGPEGYRLVAPAHIDADYSRRYGRDVQVDRAHDGVLDIAVTGGLPAASLYLALVATMAIRLWRSRGTLHGVQAAAAVAVAGYLAQQVVLFPIAEIEPLVWLLAGVALAGTLSTSPPATGRRRVDALVPSVLALLAIACLVAGALDVAADRRLAAAATSTAGGDPSSARAAADDATRLRPDSIDAWYVAAVAAASGPSLVDVDVALARVESGLDRSPLDPGLADLRERLLVERALRSGLAADRVEAAAAVEARAAADPANPLHARLSDALAVAEPVGP